MSWLNSRVCNLAREGPARVLRFCCPWFLMMSGFCSVEMDRWMLVVWSDASRTKLGGSGITGFVVYLRCDSRSGKSEMMYFMHMLED